MCIRDRRPDLMSPARSCSPAWASSASSSPCSSSGPTAAKGTCWMRGRSHDEIRAAHRGQAGEVRGVQGLSRQSLARGAGDDPPVQHPELFHLHWQGRLFAYFEYHGADYAADMARMAADPKTQEWWKIMMPLQDPVPGRPEGEWWAPMEEV